MKKIIFTITVILNIICFAILFSKGFISEIATMSYTLKHVEINITHMYLFDNYWYIFVALILLIITTISLSILNLFKKNTKLSNSIILLGVVSIVSSLLLVTLFNTLIYSNKVSGIFPPTNEIGAVINHGLGPQGLLFSFILFVTSIFDMILGSIMLK